jgi:hypothetical protein
MPDLRGISLRQAMRLVRAYGIHGEVEGTGIVEHQDPPPGAEMPDTVYLECSRETAGALVLSALEDRETTEDARERRARRDVEPARARRAARP